MVQMCHLLLLFLSSSLSLFSPFVFFTFFILCHQLLLLLSLSSLALLSSFVFVVICFYFSYRHHCHCRLLLYFSPFLFCVSSCCFCCPNNCHCCHLLYVLSPALTFVFLLIGIVIVKIFTSSIILIACFRTVFDEHSCLEG